MYLSQAGLPIQSNRDNLSIIDYRISYRLDNYRGTFIDYRYLAIFFNELE